MILSAVMLLRHLGQFESAHRLESALTRTLASGIHTKDIPGKNSLGTKEFTEEILSRIEEAVNDGANGNAALKFTRVPKSTAEVTPSSRKKIGCDVFIETNESPIQISEKLSAAIVGTPYKLKMISNRGTQVWPETGTKPALVDVFRCRFVIVDYAAWHIDSILELLRRVGSAYRWMHVEKLEELDGEIGFTKAQGEG